MSFWHRYTQQPLARLALVILSLLAIIGLLAPVIANENPIVVYHKGHFIFPIVQNTSEADLGGHPSMKSPAHFSESYIINLVNAHGWMIRAPIPYSWHTISNSQGANPAPPSKDHWMGTDSKGHDVGAQLIYGLRVSLFMGLSVTFFSMIISILVGALQGYLGGLTDLLGQRFIEIWSGMPMLFVLILLSSIMGGSFLSIFLIILLFSWVPMVGLIRAECLRVRNFDYILAAKAIGVSHARIIFRHVLPNALTASITYFPFLFTSSITTLAALDYLNFGTKNLPSIGILLREGKDNLSVPTLALFGISALAILLVCFIFVGEGLRHAHDPYHGRRSS